MRWIGAALLPLIVAGAACDRDESSLAKTVHEGKQAACSCPDLIDIRLTHDAMAIVGNIIIKVDQGRFKDKQIDDHDKTIIPLRKLLAKYHEIESRSEMGKAFVMVLVDDPMPVESMALLESTLDLSGYTYHIRSYRG